MSSNWFDFDDETASGFFDKSKIERIKKNALGMNSKKIEINENWSRSSDVNDILDLASSKCDLRGKSKLLDSLLKDRDLMRNRTSGRTSRISDVYADEFFSSGVDEKIFQTKSSFSGDRYETESQRSVDRKEKKESKGSQPEKSTSCTSANSYGFTEVTNQDARSRKDSMDSSWSRKSCQPTVNFPSSSASTISDAYGGCTAKSIGRSISRDSDDSVCTEKSINSSTISEKLADGTDKTQFETNESWLKKSTSGSKIAEKKVNDVTMTEKNDDGICEKSSTRMSYLEKSATGSSIQEEMTAERMTSSGKAGTKTVEQKTSSETFKKTHHKNLPAKSSYYDDLESSSTYDRYVPSSFSKTSSEDREKTPTLRRKDLFSSTTGRTSSSRVSEKLSKLIDEAVHQDDLFRIPSSLQTDIDKMTDDFFNTRTFGRDRARTRGRRLADLFSGVDKEESFVTCSKLTRLKSENDSLQKENLKLQSIIQDVTAVNKRWQKYNNERRLYVQKLLSTIQDLQEQINLISEKSAFQSKSNEEVGSRLGEIERLKKEHEEHVAVLELQIKSHKDDWDAERREKKKAVQEREDMENKVRELMRDVKYLKEALQEERHRKNRVCLSCQTKYNGQNDVFQRMEYCPQATSLNVSNCTNASCCTTAHIPYNTTDIPNDECYYNKENMLADDHLKNTDHSPYYTRNDMSDTFSNDRFSRTSKTKKSVTSDTVVVEDESGLRLAITEQFPSKDTSLKSILKKTEKKSKSSGNKSYSRQETKEDSASSRSRLTCTGNPDITCDDCSIEDANSFEVSIGFQSGGLTQITSSFVPNVAAANNSMQYLSIGAPHLLNVGEGINRSRSEPNTRSNSSENLKPLRESSSWNSESFGTEGSVKESVTCPDCNRVFPSSVHLKKLDHYELCQTEKNEF